MQQEQPSPTRSSKNGKWKNEMDGTKQAKEIYDTVVDKASEIYENVNVNPLSFVREYPIQAAIGGLAVGFLLGAAITRRAVAE